MLEKKYRTTGWFACLKSVNERVIPSTVVTAKSGADCPTRLPVGGAGSSVGGTGAGSSVGGGVGVALGGAGAGISAAGAVVAAGAGVVAATRVGSTVDGENVGMAVDASLTVGTVSTAGVSVG